MIQHVAHLLQKFPRQKENILAFWPFRGEPDLLSFLRKQSEESRIYFPRVDGDRISFHLWQQGAKMDVSRFGVMEPSLSSPRFEAGAGMILVPGLGFNIKGSRIGYGGGFYDKFLASPQAHDLIRLGICFSTEVLPVLISEVHDQSVHWLVTERESISCQDFRP
jgi:5-formyltetrahydrofolate cyclo-ligase